MQAQQALAASDAAASTMMLPMPDESANDFSAFG